MTNGADSLPLPLWLFVTLFVVGFPLFWALIIWIIARLGWQRVSDRFEATSDAPYSAETIRRASMSIGSGWWGPNYRSCINASLSGTGLWLWPMLLFRLFHPTIYIPWTSIRSVESERILFTRRLRVKLADDAPDLLFMGALADAVMKRRPI